jgi:hypothetical protein
MTGLGRWRRTAFAVSACLGLTACASPASPVDMSVAAASPAAATASARAYRAMRVGPINGGSQTNPLWMAGLSNTALQDAVQTSLGNLNLLAAAPADARYLVTVDVVDLDRPSVAKDPVIVFVPIAMSVSVRLHYKVAPAGGGPPVFDELVATTGTATGGQSLAPDQRVRLALEAAVKSNIVEFAARLQRQWP